MLILVEKIKISIKIRNNIEFKSWLYSVGTKLNEKNIISNFTLESLPEIVNNDPEPRGKIKVEAKTSWQDYIDCINPLKDQIITATHSNSSKSSSNSSSFSPCHVSFLGW
tara:strand:- start:563 stop:892 length:330 start_codon:yes stop_codon:yes gene_type:complete